jgi:hypothetical protein
VSFTIVAMTITDHTDNAPTTTTAAPALRPVTFDIYRDIHKSIRGELFAVTEEAGRADPASTADRTAVAAHVDAVVAYLVSHAEHEDAVVQPTVETHLPALAERIASDHERLETRMSDLRSLAADAADRFDLHRLYLELASFTSAYLAHQDLEERLVMPALEAAIGVDAVVAIHGAIIASLPPDEMMRSLALMVPAINVDDRVDLLGGMRATAPAPVFEAVWRLAGSVLSAADHAALGARLGLR